MPSTDPNPLNTPSGWKQIEDEENQEYYTDALSKGVQVGYFSHRAGSTRRRAVVVGRGAASAGGIPHTAQDCLVIVIIFNRKNDAASQKRQKPIACIKMLPQEGLYVSDDYQVIQLGQDEWSKFGLESDRYITEGFRSDLTYGMIVDTYQ